MVASLQGGAPGLERASTFASRVRAGSTDVRGRGSCHSGSLRQIRQRSATLVNGINGEADPALNH